ncbi:MAG: glycosyltransferase, partial [Desulfonatronovibrionaceae bacterium]
MLSRVILTTGGTGGHIFPAIAVARKLKERYPGCRVV